MAPRTFRKTRFHLDGTPAFEGYTDGDNWNGFEVPYFEKAQAEQIAEVVNANTHLDGMQMRYIPQRDAFVYGDNVDAFTDPAFEDEEEENEVFEATKITVDGQRIKVYSIGGYSWTWWEQDEVDANGE